MVDSAHFVKSTPLKSFHWIFSAFCRYVTDILKMCMKKFDAEKYFLTNLQGFLLSHFSMTAPSNWWLVDSVYIVKSIPLRAFIGSFQHFEDMLQTYWRCAWRSLMQKKYFWQTYRVVNLAIFSTLWRYVTDIMKMCMKKFDAEKIFFDKLTVFLT